MVKGELWLVQCLKAFGRTVVAAANMAFEFFGKDFVVPEFLEDRLVEEVLDVTGLEVVRWLGAL